MVIFPSYVGLPEGQSPLITIKPHNLSAEAMPAKLRAFLRAAFRKGRQIQIPGDAQGQPGALQQGHRFQASGP